MSVSNLQYKQKNLADSNSNKNYILNNVNSNKYANLLNLNQNITSIDTKTRSLN
jgi:hypothetical protein